MNIWTSDLTEKLREEIREHSDSISQLKKAEMKTERHQRYRFVDEKGKPHYTNAEGRKGKVVEVDEIVEHINPKSATWMEYLSLKDQVSIRLIALRVARDLQLDSCKGKLLTKDHVLEALKRCSIPHFHRRKKKRMAKKAARLIRNLSKVAASEVAA
jgi:hypothetical protein